MSFYLFRRYFFSSRSGSLIRLVSWVCLTGMVVSVTTLILIVSIMGGFSEAIKSRLLSKEAHLVIHFKDNPFLNKQASSKLDQTPKMNSATKKSLLFDKEEPPIVFSNLTKEQKEGIQSALVFETQDLILKNTTKLKGVSAIGYSQNQWREVVLQSSLWENIEPKLEGELSNPSQNTATNKAIPTPLKLAPIKEVLISSNLSLETGLFPGDELTLIPLAGLLLPYGLLPPIKKFTIKGILPDTDNQFSIHYKQGMMDFGDFSKTHYRADLKFKDSDQTSFYQNLFKQYKTQSWIERNSTLFFALKLEKLVMTLFLALALLISCLGISSSLFLLMTQKTEDLAILHTMGLSQKEITVVFSKIGFFLALIGLLMGVFMGLAGTVFLQYNSINFLSEMYQDRTIPAVFMPFNYAIIIVLTLILSWISCYFPTKYLSRIKTANLLKISGS